MHRHVQLGTSYTGVCPDTTTQPEAEHSCNLEILCPLPGSVPPSPAQGLAFELHVNELLLRVNELLHV